MKRHGFGLPRGHSLGGEAAVENNISMLENKPYIEICVKQNTEAVSQLGIFHSIILPPDCHLFEGDIFLEEELSVWREGGPEENGTWTELWSMKPRTGESIQNRWKKRVQRC